MTRGRTNLVKNFKGYGIFFSYDGTFLAAYLTEKGFYQRSFTARTVEELESKIAAKGRPESGYIGVGKVMSSGYPFPRYWWVGAAIWLVFVASMVFVLFVWPRPFFPH